MNEQWNAGWWILPSALLGLALWALLLGWW